MSWSRMPGSADMGLPPWLGKRRASALRVYEVSEPLPELAEAVARVGTRCGGDVVEQLRCQLAVELERQRLGRRRLHHLDDLAQELCDLVAGEHDVLGLRPTVGVVLPYLTHPQDDVAARGALDRTDHRSAREPLALGELVAVHRILLGWEDERP